MQFHEMLFEIKKFSFQEYVFENIACHFVSASMC